PAWRQWSASGEFQYLSERATFAGGSVPPAYLINLTVASRPLPGGIEMQLGIRNLLNRRYWDPAGIGQVMDRVEQDGRCFFLTVAWGSRFEKITDRAQSETRGAEAGTR